MPSVPARRTMSRRSVPRSTVVWPCGWSCRSFQGPISSIGCLRWRSSTRTSPGSPQSMMTLPKTPKMSRLSRRRRRARAACGRLPDAFAGVVHDEQLDAGGDQVLERGGDPAAGFVGCEVERDVFERVDDDGAGVELFGEPGEDGAVFVEHLRERARQTSSRRRAGRVRCRRPCGAGAGGLAGPVGGDVEDAAAVGGDGHPEHVGAEAGPGERELLAERGFADTVGADEHEPFAGGPADRVSRPRRGSSRCRSARRR
jgi:hypothetical protein